MKTIDLIEEKLNLEALLNLARKEPVVLLTADGKEFVLAEADDFEREVEALLSALPRRKNQVRLARFSRGDRSRDRQRNSRPA
jgi:PHD/YefM family antitoxin component YafN of YafNO toxin-antitoxin module